MKLQEDKEEEGGGGGGGGGGGERERGEEEQRARDIPFSSPLFISQRAGSGPYVVDL